MAKTATKAPVSQEDIDNSLAWAVSQGDIVNFRMQFLNFSPLRDSSSENLNAPKYDFLHPENESDPAFLEAKELMKTPAVRDHVKAQLTKKGHVQLTSDLLLKLADNAVRLGKYSSAAQAYELLRIRPKMQELFLDQADRALDQGDAVTGARGYYIAANLSYDYAAFPEPLPITRSYQKTAIMLHAVYPARPEECIALQPTEQHLRTAFSYLLMDPVLARRLDKRTVEQKIAVLVNLVRMIDPAWDDFIAKYRAAVEKTASFGERLQREADEKRGVKIDITDVVAEQQDERDPRDISAALLGYTIPNGDWWQYIKELAYKHPAATLFVSRQAVTRELEIIMPRHIADSPIVKALGLAAG